MQHLASPWQPMPTSCPATLTPLQWHWLRYPASLTQKFAELFGAEAQFCLITEGEAPMLASEHVDKGHAAMSAAWIRRSVWRYQHQVWLAARTLIPLRPAHPTLLALAGRPIGHLLFKDPDCQRVSCEYAWLLPTSPEYQAIASTPEATMPCWARRTEFRYGTDRIVISELFFPDFFAAMTAMEALCP